MPASLSSTFDIVWTGTLNSGGTATETIANPGRAFSIVSMTTFGANNAVVTLTRSATGGTAAVGSNTTAMPTIEAAITVANIEFSAADNLVLTASAAANTTRIVITCQAANAPALVVT